MSKPNFNELELQRIIAIEDKADLFDFYHDNWHALFEFAKDAAERLDEIEEMGRDE